MKKFYQTALSAAMVALLMGVTGCEQQPDSPAPNVTVASTVIQQVHAVTPSATSAQIIGTYRPVFIENMARAERGIARLASQQAATDTVSSTASSTQPPDSSENAMIGSAPASGVSVASDKSDKDVVSALLLREDLPVKPVDTASAPASAPATLSPMATIDSDKAGLRYDTAMTDLYTDSPLTTEVYDTLVDIAVFAPEVFADKEINQRLQYHSPALARMVNQHQVWQALERTRQKQAVQLQKQQEAKFNKQLEAFNKTLEEYDKKIADYQVRLSEADKANPAHKVKADEAAKYEKKP